MIDRYRKQVTLLLRVLPIVAVQRKFALKGGTAINFFWRDFPRLSVDIDVTYVPVKDRSESLADIKKCVRKIADDITNQIPDARVTTKQSGGTDSRLIIRVAGAQIKFEVNTVLRGTLFDPVEKDLAAKVQYDFELFSANQTLAFEDLYGGKLCAALDRQHPRDLFDIKLLLENEGITENIRIAFIGYLISHSRPLNELLNPNFNDLGEVYRNEFKGMEFESVTLDDLRSVQHELPALLIEGLTDKEKEFLLTFQQLEPQWDLFPVSHLKKLPGVRWKLRNIEKMDSKKHNEMKSKLENVLTRS